MKHIHQTLIGLFLLIAAFSHAIGAPAGMYYTIETIPDPDTPLLLEVGGLNFSPSGTLFVGTRRGEVWTWKDKHWKKFAEGLAECLGTLPISDTEVLVTQRGEITRLIDSDHDGVADRYEMISQDFGYTGNYHEFNFGLVKDNAGNLYGTLNLAHTGHDPWGSTFMGADVKNRGTAYKISPDGAFSTYAWGLRSPNGITLSPSGDLFCVDSQGEYVATDCLQHLLPGHFYGHPASLSFKPDFTGSPKTTTITDLAKMRTVPVVWFPYKRVGQSVTEPRFDTTAGKFGPFAGQIFCGDTVAPIVTRVFLEKVAGEYQGACFPFFKDPIIEGANRFAFGPDGALYMGLTNRGWAGGTYGIRRITWTGKMPLEIQKIELQHDGFLLTFTKPVSAAAADPATYQILHYRYEYHHDYGSDELDKTPVKVTRAEISSDRMTAHLVLPEMTPGRVYQIEIPKLAAEDGTGLRTTIAWYTLNRLKE
ncbi:MAG TPA: hypothetical protein VFE58_12255 [Tepidisphaeraceae bacterium]|jgi:hypothetical protein|nr:hypothetical protein [Tepidisphaeraceae bacterium]